MSIRYRITLIVNYFLWLVKSTTGLVYASRTHGHSNFQSSIIACMSLVCAASYIKVFPNTCVQLLIHVTWALNLRNEIMQNEINLLTIVLNATKKLQDIGYRRDSIRFLCEETTSCLISLYELSILSFTTPKNLPHVVVSQVTRRITVLGFNISIIIPAVTGKFLLSDIFSLKQLLFG